MDLERYREGDAPQDKRLLEIDIKDTETEFSQAKKRYEDSQKLLEQDYIRKSELAQHKIQFERAKVRLEGAELALKLWKKYSYPMTIKESVTGLSNSIRELTTVKKRNSSKLRQKKVLVQQAEKRLKKAQDLLEKRRKELEGMTLKAPCPGILIYGDPRHNWMRTEIRVGGNIWGGNTLFTIPDLRIMQVRIQVHEADINKLKVGQLTKVTMDTYPGLVLEGKVSKIASIAGGAMRMYNPSTASVKKFAVEITLTSKTEVTLKPGISAKAEIHIDKLENVLFVPLQCIFLENGLHYCYVADRDHRAVKREIKVGLMNDTYVEITEGLEQDAHVLLYNPNLPIEADKQDKAEKKEPTGAKKPLPKSNGSKTDGN